jgi:DUF4097 and DUF4098 domain-containing protein YvlB
MKLEILQYRPVKDSALNLKFKKHINMEMIMKSRKTYVSILTFAILMFFIPSLIFASSKDKIEKSYGLNRDGRVTLQNVSGNIIVRGSKGDHVKVTAIHAGGAKHDLNEVVYITQTNENLRIDTRRGKTFGIFRSSTSVHYELLIPENAHLKVETTSGNVDIRDVGGFLEVKTVSGNIKILTAKNKVKCKTISGDMYLEKIFGDIDIKSTSGDIRIQDVDGSLDAVSVSGDMDFKRIIGNVDLKSTSGDFRITEMKGAVEAESVSGDIDITSSSEINEINIDTISGDISTQGVLVANGSYNMDAHSGTIRIKIPSDSNFELQTRTSSGDIYCGFELKAYGKIDNKHLQGIVGKGGASLNISTYSGDIRIQKY